MPDRYDPSFFDRPGVLSFPTKGLEHARAFVRRFMDEHAVSTPELQMSRLVTLLMVVLLLTFGAVYKLSDAGGQNAFGPELALAFLALFMFAASYRSSFIRRHVEIALRGLCYLVAAWFISLASFNGFQPNYAVGLLFIIPGLGVGFSVTLRSVAPLGIFFGTTVATASLACIVYGGPSISPALFAASLCSIALVTLFVAAGRLLAQQRFHAIEERYKAVVQQASDGIYLLDAETLSFLDANPAFCGMVGMSLSDLTTKAVTDLIVAPSEPVRNACGHAFLGRHAHVSERRLRRADGTIIYVELHIDRISYADRDVLSVVVHDVSSRKEYEDRLVKAKDNAEEISRFKSSLLANMSHEIRTPLSSILGWTAVLNDELPESQRELVKLIEQSGRRLHNTLDSVLELAHLDANSKKLRPIFVNIAEEVRSIAEAAEGQAQKKGLAVRVRTDEAAWTKVDVVCFRRVLNHLIDNAIKFTDVGSVTLSVHADGSNLRIDIEDTGVGISEEFQPSMFDEFKQESAGLDRNHEGNGLGLAIVRRLIDLLGGSIGVQSRRGEGTSISIHFPVVAKHDSRSKVT